MTVAYMEILVEEASMKPLIDSVVPRVVDTPFEVRVFRGKEDLIRKLPERLRGYAAMGDAIGVVVVCDRDDADCRELKAYLTELADAAYHRTSHRDSNVLIRLAIEELESWFFGDVGAVRAVYPRVPASLAERAGFRDPDAIAGGTWQALERVLQEAGYFKGGLNKVEFSRAVSPFMSLGRNRSKSFQQLVSGVTRLCRKDV